MDRIPDNEETLSVGRQAIFMKAVKVAVLPVMTALLNASVQINHLSDQYLQTTLSILPKFREKINEATKDSQRVAPRFGTVNNRLIRVHTFEAKLLYLAIEARLEKWANAHQSNILNQINEENENDEAIDHMAVPSTVPGLVSWTFHVCYSHSYSEPVLFLQAHDQSGSPLDPESILSELEFEIQESPLGRESGNTQEEIKEKTIASRGPGSVTAISAPAVSQEHHPVLHRPFYMLHPCQTGQIMEELLSRSTERLLIKTTAAVENSNSRNDDGLKDGCMYLLAWLSVVGRPMGVAPTPAEWQDAVTKL